MSPSVPTDFSASRANQAYPCARALAQEKQQFSLPPLGGARLSGIVVRCRPARAFPQPPVTCPDSPRAARIPPVTAAQAPGLALGQPLFGTQMDTFFQI